MRSVIPLPQPAGTKEIRLALRDHASVSKLEIFAGIRPDSYQLAVIELGPGHEESEFLTYEFYMNMGLSLQRAALLDNLDGGGAKYAILTADAGLEPELVDELDYFRRATPFAFPEP